MILFCKLDMIDQDAAVIRIGLQAFKAIVAYFIVVGTNLACAAFGTFLILQNTLCHFCSPPPVLDPIISIHG